MADIMLHTSNNTGITCVSNTFIDDFMKEANGEYVKVYLYLLRCLNRDGFDFSISQLADCLDHTEKDVMRALTYWEKVGLLHLEYSPANELSGICLTDVNGTDKAYGPVISNITSMTTSARYTGVSGVASTAGAPAVSNTTVEKPNYSPDELKAFSEDTEVSDLIFATQTYLGKMLSVQETTTLLFWYDSLHMSVDLIQYLIETCIGGGHSSFHYMDTVARNWAEDGISTVDAAIKASSARNNTVYSIMKALGITGRALVETELNYIDKWTTTFSMDLDIICEACKRTIIQTNKPSFPYADKIITTWQKAGVKSLDDIAKLDADFTAASVAKITTATRQRSAQSSTATKTKSSSKFHNFSQRDYNFDELEKKILGN